MRFFLSRAKVSNNSCLSKKDSVASSAASADGEAALTVDDLPERCVFNVCVRMANGKSSEKTVQTSRAITGRELLAQLVRVLMLPPAKKMIGGSIGGAQPRQHRYSLVIVDRRGEAEISADDSPVLVELFARRRLHPECTLTMKHEVVAVEMIAVQLQVAGQKTSSYSVPRGCSVVEALGRARARGVLARNGVQVSASGRRVPLTETLAEDALLRCTYVEDEAHGQPGSSAAELVKAIGRDTANYACVDCRAPNPAFVACNLGVTLCASCALGHCRGFLLERLVVTRVRPIRDYAWAKEVVAILRAAGNTTAGNPKGSFPQKYALRVEPGIDAALMEAVLQQNILQTMQALQAGADPNGCGPVTPLLIACFLGCPSIIELLLRFGADPGRVDCFNQSPLFYLMLQTQPDEGQLGKLKSCQTFHAFLAAEHRRLYPEDEPNVVAAERNGSIKDDILLQKWLTCIGMEQTPSMAALAALGLEPRPFLDILPAVFREVDARSKANKIVESSSAAGDGGPYAHLSQCQYRRLLDGVLEELGMREYIAVHSPAWRARLASVRWLAGAPQRVLVSPYGPRTDMEDRMEQEEQDRRSRWMGRVREQHERDRCAAAGDNPASPAPSN